MPSLKSPPPGRRTPCTDRSAFTIGSRNSVTGRTTGSAPAFLNFVRTSSVTRSFRLGMIPTLGFTSAPRFQCLKGKGLVSKQPRFSYRARDAIHGQAPRFGGRGSSRKIQKTFQRDGRDKNTNDAAGGRQPKPRR